MKDDLIRRKTVLDALDEIESEVADGMGYQYDKWRDYFIDLPSAQSEIIRCKDCKYFQPLDENVDYNFCDAWAGGTNEDMFCGFAERRQDADSSGNMSGTQKELKCTETHSCVYELKKAATDVMKRLNDRVLQTHSELLEMIQETHSCDYERTATHGWIPVTEALPEKPFGCLVTVCDTDPVTLEDFENILPYFVGYDGKQWNDWEGEQCPFEVLAWLPLPEPYAERKEDASSR